MKAVVYEKYGPPEVLTVREITRPAPKNKEILVKIMATTVSAGDWRMRKADPFLVRLFNGLLKPRRVKILGFEIAGVVEGVGKDVKAFEIGDAVFASCGLNFGGYAEYVCLPENHLIAKKPFNMTFAEAASVPIGGLTAFRFLKQSQLKAGERILIFGASGSVGTFAVQIAKYFGAEVTGVCSTSNIELVKTLGSINVIDYTREDIKHSGTFDVVFDAVGKLKNYEAKSLIKRNGRYVTVSRTPKENPDDLAQLKELIEAGVLRTVIDRTYSLDQIREAHAYVETFRKKGNVIINVASPTIQNELR